MTFVCAGVSELTNDIRYAAAAVRSLHTFEDSTLAHRIGKELVRIMDVEHVDIDEVVHELVALSKKRGARRGMRKTNSKKSMTSTKSRSKQKLMKPAVSPMASPRHLQSSSSVTSLPPV